MCSLQYVISTRQWHARSEMSETDFCVFILFTGTHSPRNGSYRYACAGSIRNACDYLYRIIISLYFSYQGVSLIIRTYVYALVYCVFMYDSHPSYHVWKWLLMKMSQVEWRLSKPLFFSDTRTHYCFNIQ